ncbi:hypothetical protein SUDANB121_03304 [Nocardiopsis dassonvillei]|uniref:hypothetical protein n=1 Tax=Nocardiopsis dassonvillei TaxID=2014 RepID=UPI003F5778BA
MAHHAHSDGTPGRPLPFLPGDRVLRAAILSVGAAAVAVTVLGLYLFGGLDAAAPEPKPPGTELRNILYRITPQEAEPASDEVEGAVVRVLANVELHGSDLPVSMFDIASTMDVRLLPGEHEVKFPDLTLARYPQGVTSRLQPHMPEEALISWPLPSGVAPDEVEAVRITVRQTEKITVTDGNGFLWSAIPGSSVGTVDLPLREG